MLQLQQKLRECFDYLQVKQRWVLCYFTLLAIINARTIRLCLDFSLHHIIRESRRLSNAVQEPPPPPGRLKAGQSMRSKRRMTVKTVEASPVTLTNSSDVWTKEVQVLVTVSFYVGYIITHIPGGRLAERCGGKWILGASILFSALFTLLTPAIVRHGGPQALIVLRLVIGLCEGPTYPAVSALLAQWVPESERGLLCSCVLSGGEIGITLMHLVSGVAMQEEDWPMAFYVVGGGAVLWFVGFVLVCYSNPDDSPYIQSSEREYIKRQVSHTLMTTQSAASVTEPAPWMSMLNNAPIWALIAATMQHDWSQQELTRELQRLLHNMQAKGSTIWQELEASLMVTSPHLCSWLATLSSGKLSDYLIERGILSRTETRRLMCCLIFISISMYLVYGQANGVGALTVVAVGAYYAGIKVLPLDMSPNFAGTLMGISNGLGSLPGLLMPLLQQLDSEYGIVRSIRAALWLICVGHISGDVQTYNQPILEGF